MMETLEPLQVDPELNRRSYGFLARNGSRKNGDGLRKKKKDGLWKLTPLMEIRPERGFPPRLGKHKALPTVSTRPYGDCLSLRRMGYSKPRGSGTKKGTFLIW
jgi:hypothetical protein